MSGAVDHHARMEDQLSTAALKTRVVDTHVHLLPGRLGAKVRQFFAPVEEELVYPAEHARVLTQLAAEGIDEIWNLPYSHKPGVAEWLNEQTAQIAGEASVPNVVVGATVHPGDHNPLAVVRQAVEVLGARVLKLHCSVGAFHADDARLDQMWFYAAAIRLPVVVHVGHDSNGRTRHDELDPVHAVADRHPEARVVVAHCGLPAETFTLDLIERHANVYADLTPVTRVIPTVPPERLEGLAKRLLFGSDAPNTAITAADGLARLRSLTHDQTTLDLICHGNADRMHSEVNAT